MHPPSFSPSSSAKLRPRSLLGLTSAVFELPCLPSSPARPPPASHGLCTSWRCWRPDTASPQLAATAQLTLTVSSLMAYARRQPAVVGLMSDSSRRRPSSAARIYVIVTAICAFCASPPGCSSGSWLLQGLAGRLDRDRAPSSVTVADGAAMARFSPHHVDLCASAHRCACHCSRSCRLTGRFVVSLP